ncbi:MAG: TonB-dependent receptor [Bacteroidetes bacterium]|jgi:iron complex outermembrane receptor protein|nr:TonB-dependent receptor [Bacteroidota bacterium]
MKNIFRLLVAVFLFQLPAMGQQNHKISGKVIDENGKALPGATVVLNLDQKGVVTDTAGTFVFSGLRAGEYEITVSFLGYKEFHQRIYLRKNVDLDIQLSPSTMSLQEVVVVDHHNLQRKKEEPLGIEIVGKDYIKQNLGGSLMSSLERLPGVTTIDIGSGHSKPVIRGLSFNRVVVVENGIKHEGQQWGVDHGLEIDQYAADNIEVIKGPESLKFGSDAIGGVVNIKQNEIPAQNTFAGTVDISGQSNNNLLGTSLSLQGRKEWFFAKVRATIVDYADFKVPTDSVYIYSYRTALHNNRIRNVAGNELNYHATIGIITRDVQSKLYISQTHSKSGFFANTHGFEPRNIDTELHDKSDRDTQDPYQNVSHLKIINISKWRSQNLQVEAELGFQRNFRQEWSQYVSHGYMPAVFPDSLPFRSDLERQFKKDYFSGNIRADYKVNNNLSLSIGLNSNYQDNRIDGRGFIIPAFQQSVFGGHLLTKYAFSEKSAIRIGGRFDYSKIHTDPYYDWFPSPVIEGNDTSFQHLQRALEIDRRFSNGSFSVGYNYNAANWTYKANIGKSFRVPTAKELSANGVNYHRFSYEVGNPGLSPEISWQADVGVEYNGKKMAAGISPFMNYFSNYIYLNPTYRHDRLYGNGNQIFNYTQSRVFRYGGEIHAHYQVIPPIKLGVIGEYVYSEQLSGEKKGFTLPFSPPPSVILNMKYQRKKTMIIENAYLSLDYKITATQNNIVPPEETTDGYQVINIAFGGNFSINNQMLSLSFQVQNLLNSKYFNHTSYYRLINVPEPGRNFILNISLPFSVKFKTN